MQTTPTKLGGGYAFEVLVPGTYTVTIEGQSLQVDVNAENVKVDLRGGAIEKF